MEIELLVVPDCPHEDAVAILLCKALEHLAMPPLKIRTTVIDTQQEAEARDFVGSPTILIDGIDPFVHEGLEPTVGGIPSLSELCEALERATEVTTIRSSE